ncbi:MAG TPA: hypothetical protein VFM37_11735 [Pseudonocardiaceae bacterium]|nr:hypothetical protein [Pseudonocardiaceae bacterium]
MSGYCGCCGVQLGGQLGGQFGGQLDAPGHERCATRLRLEPPRFCAACGRRMVVQVTPTGWWAQCSRHGRTGSG